MMTILGTLYRFIAVMVFATLSAMKRGGTLGRENGLSEYLLGLRQTIAALGSVQFLYTSKALQTSSSLSGVPDRVKGPICSKRKLSR